MKETHLPMRGRARFYKVIQGESGVFTVGAENTTEGAIISSEGKKMGGGPSGAPLEAVPFGGFGGWQIKDKGVLDKLEENLGKRGTGSVHLSC